MLAALISAPGGAPVATEFAEPTEPAGHQVVEVVAAGLHPVVRALVSGQHYGGDDAWPQIPGVDAVARTAGGELVYAGYTPAPYAPSPSGWPSRWPCPCPPTQTRSPSRPE